jgi:hypothetical protein
MWRTITAWLSVPFVGHTLGFVLPTVAFGAATDAESLPWVGLTIR